MSFARAQRFNYKNPDCGVSPADYDVSVSSFNKGAVIPKCPRFQKSSERQSMAPTIGSCRRANCCRRNINPRYSQLESSSSSRDGNTSTKSGDFSRSRFSRSSLRKHSSSTPKIDPNKMKNKQTSASLETLPRNINFHENVEFIDDDYADYTSSEEIDNLKTTEEYEYKEVCTAYAILMERPNNNVFENMLLQKLNNIENTMEKFKSDLAFATKEMEINRLQMYHASEKNKMENVKKYMENEASHISQATYQKILEIIANAIRNLNQEFETKRRKVLKENENRILQLIDDMYDISNSSAREINHFCNETAIDISKRIFNVVNSNDSDLSLTHHRENLLDKMKSEFNKNHECFNYENICKLLSDKLQDTQNELEILEEDNLDITLKYHDTQQALEVQSSLIEDLHIELSKLKKSIGNDST